MGFTLARSGSRSRSLDAGASPARGKHLRLLYAPDAVRGARPMAEAEFSSRRPGDAGEGIGSSGSTWGGFGRQWRVARLTDEDDLAVLRQGAD